MAWTVAAVLLLVAVVARSGDAFVVQQGRLGSPLLPRGGPVARPQASRIPALHATGNGGSEGRAKDLRVGIIGAGRIGQVHLDTLAAVDGVSDALARSLYDWFHEAKR